MLPSEGGSRQQRPDLAVLSRDAPSALLIRWFRAGALELIASRALLRSSSAPSSIRSYASGIPDDDYLLALAFTERAFLVTGDQHCRC
ncbi:MAG: hypothetical protein M3070_16170 [Actinomycetota bacterium]|nr:hypothetical protein [Actinomycetota bacterium]